ncbi:cytochrome P450 [Paraburkholderia sp. J12]|uniref:cytochrome P450 n=1 Tax=Paraburkholderia sp. J12 TaxID=2805432 RepID=UPI002ABD387D|nr:cytochrome P450 [Paraburkholderia sp. J12]
MNTPTSSRCPFHAEPPSAPVERHPPGVWPPGPPAGLLGWGLLRSMARDLPSTLADWQRTYGDVVHLHIRPEHVIGVTDPALVRELLVTHHTSLIRWERGIGVFREVHGHSVLVAEGEAWRSKRHALQPGFAPKPVEAFVPAIAAVTEQTLAAWPVGNPDWPIESALTSLAMDVIVRMLFSQAIGDDARVAEQAVRTTSEAANAEFYALVSGPDWLPWKRAKREAVAALKNLIDRHLQMRLRVPEEQWPDDLLTRLLRLHRDAPQAWPLQAIRDECMTIFLAGHETSAATLTWWAWCMASNPEAQAIARDEINRVLQGRLPEAGMLGSLRWLKQTIEETLRLYPAAPLLISRRTTQPVALGAWQFPARTLFMLPVQVMHHDARWFPEPERFLPQRFAADAPPIPRGAWLPFGAGPRVCLGQHLAMNEMMVIAAMVLQQFVLEVPAGAAAPRPVLNITLRPDRAVRLGVKRIEAQR